MKCCLATAPPGGPGMIRFALGVLLLLAVALAPCLGDPANGWRGNGTGLWPDARPPIEWYRIPRGAIADLRARADRPGDKAGADARPLEKGIIRDWLMVGPFPVKDAAQDLDKVQLAGDADWQPAENDKAGDLAWKKIAATIDDPFAFGPADLPWTDVAPLVGGYKNNQVAYLHTYLHSPKGGTVRAVVEHAHGMKAWLNGKEIYKSTNRGDGM